MKQSFKTKYFGPSSFYKEVIAIGLPIMLQMLIQNLVSLIDNFMVAGLGDIKMSGVNIAGQLLFVFMVLINTICTSGGIFMSQFFGAGDKEGMKQSLKFKLILGVLGFLIYVVICFVIPDKVLRLLVVNNTDAEEILSYALQYIHIMGFVGIPMTLATILSSSLREIGKVKPPLVIAISATLLNTFLDWVLIYGKFGLPALEVRGAAIATVIAMSFQAIAFLIYIFVTKPPFLIPLKELFKINWQLFFSILKKSLMVLSSEMLWVVSETITTALYNSRGGADVVSGMASSFAIANLFFVAFGGITSATGVVLGKTLGQGDLSGAKQKKNWLMMSANIFGVFMCFFGLLTMLLIPIVFMNLSHEAQTLCKKMVFGMSLLMPAWVYINTQFAVSRAGGDTMMGMIVDGATTLLVIIPGMFLMTFLTPIGPVGMYMIIKMVDFPKILVANLWLKKEKWLKNLTNTIIPD